MHYQSVLQDLRYGMRLLRRNSGFTAVAVLALAIGIGVNTAVFTAYQAMVLRPLDGKKPGELVNIALTEDSGSGATFKFSYPDYQTYRADAHSFSGLIAFRQESLRLSMAGGGIAQPAAKAESVMGALGLLSAGSRSAEFASVFAVSENYFDVLGVKPARGRTFSQRSRFDLAPSPTVLISENYWQRRFAADPKLLGKTIRLNGASMAIIGIMPHNFLGTGATVPDFWLPISLEPEVHADSGWLSNRENAQYRLFGRRAQGVSVEQAQAEMTVLANRARTLHQRDPETAKHAAQALVWNGSPFPLPLRFYPGLRLTAFLIMLAAAMVLLVACANVGSLQLARARTRHNELHTRLSLGASRWRVTQQLLTESSLLAVLAGGVALIMTTILLRTLVALAAEAVPVEFGTLVFEVTPDGRIFAYVTAVSLIAGIFFGLTPAMESSRAALISNARGSTESRGNRRMQNLLVAVQVSLTLALLISGSLLIRSSIQAVRAETGYESGRTIALDVRFPETADYTPARKVATMRELRRRLDAMPGVASATSARPPADIGFRTAAVSMDGASLDRQQTQQSTMYYTRVQGNYFQTLGIPITLGRSFRAGDRQAERSVVLSEAAARELWPKENPVGRSVRLGNVDERRPSSRLVADGPAYQVIGIARDTRGVEVDGSDSKRIYLPLTEGEIVGRPMLIRTTGDPTQVNKTLEAAIFSLDPNLIASASTLDAMLRQTAPFITATLAAMVASVVGSLGLLLACMGIYGTVSYVVVMRTREIAIRMAVGAQKRDILRVILIDGLQPVIWGVLTGMVLATGVAHLLRGALYGVTTLDPIAFVGTAGLFLAISLLAIYSPSRRAVVVDPMVVLRDS